MANSLANLRGGDKEIRTLDPLRARQVLSQLSYIPMVIYCCFMFSTIIYRRFRTKLKYQ